MLNAAEETLRLAEEEMTEEPSPGAKDRVAEGHFAVGLCYLFQEGLTSALSHFNQQLCIKVEIGKVAGIAATLTSIGRIIVHIMTEPEDERIRALGSAFLLLARQVTDETAMTGEPDDDELLPLLPLLRDHPAYVTAAEDRIRDLAPRLLPQFHRAVKRWL